MLKTFILQEKWTKNGQLRNIQNMCVWRRQVRSCLCFSLFKKIMQQDCQTSRVGCYNKELEQIWEVTLRYLQQAGSGVQHSKSNVIWCQREASKHLWPKIPEANAFGGRTRGIYDTKLSCMNLSWSSDTALDSSGVGEGVDMILPSGLCNYCTKPSCIHTCGTFPDAVQISCTFGMYIPLVYLLPVNSPYFTILQSQW